MKKVILSSLLLLVFAEALFAQAHDNVALGFSVNRLYQFGDFDNVNVMNGNLVVNVPIGIAYRVDESLSLQFGATYNSKVWSYRMQPDPNLPADPTMHPKTYPNFRANSGLGWRVSLGSLLSFTRNNPAPLKSDDPDNPHGWIYEGPAGDEHEFNSTVAGQTTPADSTYLRLRLSGSSLAYVDFPNGEIRTFTKRSEDGLWRLTKITSALGRDVTIDYSFDNRTPRRVTRWTITDTAISRTLYVFLQSSSMTDTDDYGQIVSAIELPGVGSARLTYTFNYTQTDVVHGCEGWDFKGVPRTLSLPLLTSITAPAPDGTSWTFAYTPSSAIPDCMNGIVQKITLPTGGTYQYKYGTWSFPPTASCDSDADLSIRQTAAVISRSVNGAEWKYYHDIAQPSATSANAPKCWTCPDPVNALAGTCYQTVPPVPPIRWVRTAILDPNGTRTDHYFPVGTGMQSCITTRRISALIPTNTGCPSREASTTRPVRRK